MRSVLHHSRAKRRGAILLLAALLMVLMIGMIAFGVDMGIVVMTRTQLQSAADSSAMAAAASMGLAQSDMQAVARQYANYHKAGTRNVQLQDSDVQYGTWDVATRVFAASATPGNAIKVTTRCDANSGGSLPLFFASIFGMRNIDVSTSAVAMANPRDICFVIDLSGSMNNDTEPCWATSDLDSTYAAQGYPNVGTNLMQQVYTDCGFGAYPGIYEYVGATWGVAANSAAYANLTRNGGPLTAAAIPATYRILSGDSEAVRKQKAYSILIDQVIARVMPGVRPPASSASYYSYWEKYLDYVMQRYNASGRGWLPPNQYSYGLDDAGGGSTSYYNQIGYRTYAQFMMDHGRDLKVDGVNYTPLSVNSPLCYRHAEATDGGTFHFPLREQPTHASRRAVIAAIKIVKDRNQAITNMTQRDWVSIVTFDKQGATQRLVSLTGDYDAAMAACVNMQAVGDNSASTDTEAGLVMARNHLLPANQGGAGRYSTNKVVVLLTDGEPNLFDSSSGAINSYKTAHPSSNFYSSGNTAQNAALMQSSTMQGDKWSMYPVGLGLGTDYDFLDRMARMGGTADNNGQSARGSGNPAEYEQRMKDIFQKIITNPKVRLVQ